MEPARSYVSLFLLVSGIHFALTVLLFLACIPAIDDYRTPEELQETKEFFEFLQPLFTWMVSGPYSTNPWARWLPGILGWVPMIATSGIWGLGGGVVIRLLVAAKSRFILTNHRRLGRYPVTPHVSHDEDQA